SRAAEHGDKSLDQQQFHRSTRDNRESRPGARQGHRQRPQRFLRYYDKLLSGSLRNQTRLPQTPALPKLSLHAHPRRPLREYDRKNQRNFELRDFPQQKARHCYSFLTQTLIFFDNYLVLSHSTHQRPITPTI